MNEKDIKRIVSTTINEVLDERNESIMCSIGIEKEVHEEEHRFIKNLMGISDRLGAIGWGFIGSAMKTLGMAVIGFICLCALVWAKVELKNLLN